MFMYSIGSTNNISFTSKINPVKPYKIMTKAGNIYVSEVDIEKELSPKLINQINKFFCENFSEHTKDKNYMQYRTVSLKEKKQREQESMKYYSDIFNNLKIRDNITILLAKDSKNNIQGACLSAPYTGVPGSEKTTLWIDSLAVNDKYRNVEIASELLNKTIEINKNSFTDVFLTGTLFAKNFYKKLGFKNLDRKNPDQKKVYNYLCAKRYDVPKYVIPFTKIIQPDKPRWYEISAKAINITA